MHAQKLPILLQTWIFHFFLHWRKHFYYWKRRAIWVTPTLWKKVNGSPRDTGKKKQARFKERTKEQVNKAVYRRDVSIKRDILKPVSILTSITELYCNFFCFLFLFIYLFIYLWYLISFGLLIRVTPCYQFLLYFRIPVASNLLECKTGFTHFLTEDSEVSFLPIKLDLSSTNFIVIILDHCCL